MRILKGQKKVVVAAAVLLAGVLSSLPALADPTISVSANPVPIPDGQTSATATITWDADENPTAEVWIKEEDDKEKKFSGDDAGSKTVTIELDKKYKFTLYSTRRMIGPFKNPLAEVLASLTVTGVRQATTPNAKPDEVVPPPKDAPPPKDTPPKDAPPPDGKNTPTSFAGAWDTIIEGGARFEMRLEQVGDKVTGTFAPDNGKIEGTLQGTALHFKWTRDGGPNDKLSGNGQFNLSQDAQSFTGSFSMGDNPAAGGASWNGTRSRG